MRMKIFITGGSGFLGQRVINRLQTTKHELVGLARSERSVAKLQKMKVEPVSGSLENISEWQQNLAAMDIVIHCAAPVEFWGPWEKYQTGIVDATKNLFQASENNGVKRFIYISSESVLQDHKDLVDIDETEPYPKTPNSYYGKSKMLAEKFILSQEGSMESIILRPTFIWGKAMPALNTLVTKLKSGDFMWIDYGRSLLEVVHVDNVAEAITLACEKGKHKNVYFVTDNNTQTTKEFLTKLLSTQNIVPPDKNIPKAVADVLASVVEGIWKFFNIQKAPPITRFDVAFVAMSRKYRIDKIIKNLGYQPVVAEAEGLKQLKIHNSS